MSLIDFQKIDRTSFHKLCNDLVKAEFPDAKCVEGSGGDEGIDCYSGHLSQNSHNLHVFQHKHLPQISLSPNGKNQIIRSLEQLVKNYPNVYQWTLVISKDFTPQEIKWFEKLNRQYHLNTLDYRDSTKLKSLLREHYRIRYDYFPIPESVRSEVDKHLEDLKSRVVKPLIGLLRPMLTFNYTINLSMNSIISLSSIGLYDDLITNHYPDVGKNIDVMKKLTTKISSQGKLLVNQIKKLLKEYLKHSSICYEERIHNNKNSIPIERSVDRLWQLIETNSYRDKEFTIYCGDPETPRIIFGSLGYGIIYECLPRQDCKKIVKVLQRICKRIISDISDALNEYHKVKNEWRLKIKTLLDQLDQIEFTYKLNFRDIDKIKCKYIRSLA